MSNLRYLILYTFLGGMCFDSFMSSLIRNKFGTAFIFAVVVILLMNQAIKLYDKVKVK